MNSPISFLLSLLATGLPQACASSFPLATFTNTCCSALSSWDLMLLLLLEKLVLFHSVHILLETFKMSVYLPCSLPSSQGGGTDAFPLAQTCAVEMPSEPALHPARASLLRLTPEIREPKTSPAADGGVMPARASPPASPWPCGSQGELYKWFVVGRSSVRGEIIVLALVGL